MKEREIAWDVLFNDLLGGIINGFVFLAKSIFYFILAVIISCGPLFYLIVTTGSEPSSTPLILEAIATIVWLIVIGVWEIFIIADARFYSNSIPVQTISAFGEAYDLIVRISNDCKEYVVDFCKEKYSRYTRKTYEARVIDEI